jgi:hypothetical protein
MRVVKLFKTKLIDPIIDQIVDRVGDRMAQVLGKNAGFSSGTQKILSAPPGATESTAENRDLRAGQHAKIESMSYAKIIGELAAPQHPPAAPRKRSELCKQADFSLDAYRYWSSAIRLAPALHRKHWEFFYICQALYERGFLDDGRTGLGFGVGREPLPALFASLGCVVVATDQAPDDAVSGGWKETGQHADGLAALERSDICASATFRERVSFEPVDMNDIPRRFANRFDFCWSACSLEHLGSLEHGLRFIAKSIDTLKIGGVAIHTTEFNLSSDADTYESRGLSIYRRCDVETLLKQLEQAGHRVEPLDLNKGTTFVDGYIDLPPYRNEPHLRLKIEGYDCTSIGLIITRGR